MRFQRGFTLIELMIVIALIGIISSIIIPSYSGFIAVAKIGEGPQITREYRNMIQEFYAHRGYFPKNNKALAVPPEHLISGTNISRVVIQDGEIIAYFRDESLNDGQPLVSYPCTNIQNPASPLLWNCERLSIEDRSGYKRSTLKREE